MSYLRIHKKTGRLKAFGGAYTFKYRQSSLRREEAGQHLRRIGVESDVGKDACEVAHEK